MIHCCVYLILISSLSALKHLFWGLIRNFHVHYMISEDVNRAITFAASIKMIIYPQVTAVIHRWLVFHTERYKCFF